MPRCPTGLGNAGQGGLSQGGTGGHRLSFPCFCSPLSFFSVFIALGSPPSRWPPWHLSLKLTQAVWPGGLSSWLQPGVPRRGDLGTHVEHCVASWSSRLHSAGWGTLGTSRLPGPTPVDRGISQRGPVGNRRRGGICRIPAVTDGVAQGAEGRRAFRGQQATSPQSGLSPMSRLHVKSPSICRSTWPSETCDAAWNVQPPVMDQAAPVRGWLPGFCSGQVHQNACSCEDVSLPRPVFQGTHFATAEPGGWHRQQPCLTPCHSSPGSW